MSCLELSREESELPPVQMRAAKSLQMVMVRLASSTASAWFWLHAKQKYWMMSS